MIVRQKSHYERLFLLHPSVHSRSSLSRVGLPAPCLSLSSPNASFGELYYVVDRIVDQMHSFKLGFHDRKEIDVLQLIYSVSLIAKRSGLSRTRTTTTTSTRRTPQIRNLG